MSQTPSQVRAAGGSQEYNVLFTATHGNPSQGCNLTTGQLCTAQLSYHSHPFSGIGAPGIGQYGGPVSGRLHFHLHVPSLWKERGVGVSGFMFIFFFFSCFWPKVNFWCLSYGSYPQSSVYSYSALMNCEGLCVCDLCASRGGFIFRAPFWGSVMQCVHKHGTFSSLVLSNTANAGKCDCSDFHPSVSLGKDGCTKKTGHVEDDLDHNHTLKDSRLFLTSAGLLHCRLHLQRCGLMYSREVCATQLVLAGCSGDIGRT